MVFLFEAKLNDQKNIFFALLDIFGLGKTLVVKICKKAGFSENLKLQILSNEQLGKLIKIINTINLVATNLKKFEFANFKQKLNIKLLKSIRQTQGLPVRGQRTHTNAKTAKKKL